jgi:hypothetical protein
MKTITEHQSKINSHVNLSDNKFASGCMNIRIWCNNYTCLKTLTGHDGHIEALLYLANNNTLLSGSFIRLSGYGNVITIIVLKQFMLIINELSVLLNYLRIFCFRFI